MSSYFTLPSFARAKKNQEELQKSNPQNPVLKEDDERFLERQISQHDQVGKEDEAAKVTKITDDGKAKTASAREAKAAEGDPIIPATKPEPSVATRYDSRSSRKSFELPSQEEAEKITGSWNSAVKLDDGQGFEATRAEKRTWASYLPNKLQPAKKDSTTDVSYEEGPDSQGNTRTWGEYASNLMLSRESLNVWPESWPFSSKDQDAKAEPVYNEDGSVNQEKTKEKQEKEVSVLLDNLNMSTINNRVFAFSSETQRFYDRFVQCLKDTMNGVPTAYDDMDKLMRDAGPTLEKQFKSMPPFVQTLVKSLPAKLGTTLAPEIMAAASEKPGADLKKRTERTSEAQGEGEGKSEKKKKKKTIPGLKSLMSKEGVIATMLRNTVNFLTTRFPFLASTTNVVVSLAVFSKCCSLILSVHPTDKSVVLMFVFWYCHKRGKEVRLSKESEAGIASMDKDENEDNIEVSSNSDEEDDNNTAAELEKTLDQPDPAAVPLPRGDTGLKV